VAKTKAFEIGYIACTERTVRGAPPGQRSTPLDRPILTPRFFPWRPWRLRGSSFFKQMSQAGADLRDPPFSVTSVSFRGQFLFRKGREVKASAAVHACWSQSAPMSVISGKKILKVPSRTRASDRE